MSTESPKAVKLTPTQLAWLKSLALMESERRALSYSERANSTEPTRYKMKQEGLVVPATYLILFTERGTVSLSEVTYMLTDAGRAAIGLAPRDPAAMENEMLLHAAWHRQRSIVGQVRAQIMHLEPHPRRMGGYGDAFDATAWAQAMALTAARNAPVLAAAATEVEEALARCPSLSAKMAAAEEEVRAADRQRQADMMRGEG